MTSVYRVAWREGQSHCAKDHDTQAAAEAHVARLVVNPKVPIAFFYPIPIYDGPADAPQPPATAPLTATGLIRKVLGRSNEGEVA